MCISACASQTTCAPRHSWTCTLHPRPPNPISHIKTTLPLPLPVHKRDDGKSADTAQQPYNHKKDGNNTTEANPTAKEWKNTPRNVRFDDNSPPITPSHSDRTTVSFLNENAPTFHRPGNANVTPTRNESTSSSITTQQLRMPVITEESRWNEAFSNAPDKEAQALVIISGAG